MRKGNERCAGWDPGMNRVASPRWHILYAKIIIFPRGRDAPGHAHARREKTATLTARRRDGGTIRLHNNIIRIYLWWAIITRVRWIGNRDRGYEFVMDSFTLYLNQNLHARLRCRYRWYESSALIFQNIMVIFFFYRRFFMRFYCIATKWSPCDENQKAILKNNETKLFDISNLYFLACLSADWWNPVHELSNYYWVLIIYYISQYQTKNTKGNDISHIINFGYFWLWYFLLHCNNCNFPLELFDKHIIYVIILRYSILYIILSGKPIFVD